MHQLPGWSTIDGPFPSARCLMAEVRRTFMAATVFIAALAGCTPPRPPARQAAPDLQPRLSAADALVRIGCFDCLIEALREYDAIRVVEAAPAQVSDAAIAGAIRAAALL